MSGKPDFHFTPITIDSHEEFQPALPSRRGEFIAWACCLLVGGLGAGLWYYSGQIPCLNGILFLFFLLAGTLISFGRWMDANTVFSVDESGLHQNSPLRKVTTPWDQISALRASPAGIVWRIVVSDPLQHIRFRVQRNPDSDSRNDFPLALPNGDRLLQIILGMGKLTESEEQGSDRIFFKADPPASITDPSV